MNIQAKPIDRTNENSLDKMFVRNADGQMIQISEFVKLSRSYGPPSVSRFNLYNSVTITGGAAQGYSSGDAIAAVNELAKDLPTGFDIAYSGLTREEIISGGQSVYIFILSLMFVYLFLAAQYESYILPFAVLLSLPFGIFGAFAGTALLGLENNIYFQVGLIMLIGLLAKNAILIVEFALQHRHQGNSIIESAWIGAQERLRPILMTSFAFILGLFPLVIASGVGAAGNRSIGSGAVAGLFFGTVLGVMFIPVLFVVFQSLQEKISKTQIVENANK